jgi:hypothetical protein
VPNKPSPRPYRAPRAEPPRRPDGCAIATQWQSSSELNPDAVRQRSRSAQAGSTPRSQPGKLPVKKGRILFQHLASDELSDFFSLALLSRHQFVGRRESFNFVNDCFEGHL